MLKDLPKIFVGQFRPFEKKICVVEQKCCFLFFPNPDFKKNGVRRVEKKKRTNAFFFGAHQSVKKRFSNNKTIDEIFSARFAENMGGS
jgi:hypothetical protein